MLSFLRLLRIPQYTKNGFVLLPLFFSGQMFHTPSLVRCGAAFVAFCFAASAIYILNDIHDVEEDGIRSRKTGLLPAVRYLRAWQESFLSF